MHISSNWHFQCLAGEPIERYKFLQIWLSDHIIIFMIDVFIPALPFKCAENVESYFWNSLKGTNPLNTSSFSRRDMRSLSCMTSSFQPSPLFSWWAIFWNVLLRTQFSRYFCSSLIPRDLPLWRITIKKEPAFINEWLNEWRMDGMKEGRNNPMNEWMNNPMN